MYLINVLVPFNTLIDTDMGLLKLIEFDYHDYTMFHRLLLNTSEINQRYFLVTRKHSNVIESLLTVDDKELADDLLSQFMEKEYDQILKLSCNTAICDLTVVLRSNINQVIRVTVMCSCKEEQDMIVDRHINVFKTIIDTPETVSLKDYGTIFVKDVKDLDRYRYIEGKTIYVPNYGFNVTIDPNESMPLLPLETLQKYGKSNEFEIYTPYVFDPRKLPRV